jgi:hypothetical protein
MVLHTLNKGFFTLDSVEEIHMFNVGFGSFFNKAGQAPTPQKKRPTDAPLSFQGQQKEIPALQLNEKAFNPIKMTGPGTGDQGLE